VRYTCILLITVLMFSQPLSSLAETNDPEVIRTRAKEDANRDVSRLRWFGSGVGIMGGTLCGTVCCLGIISLSNTSEPPDFLMGSLTVSIYLIPIVGLTAISRHSPSPPAERLIGKSPLYVSIYTDTYQSHARDSDENGSVGVLFGRRSIRRFGRCVAHACPWESISPVYSTIPYFFNIGFEI